MDFTNYNRDSICFFCPGTKSAGRLRAYNYRADALCLEAATTHEAFARERPGLAIMSLPGTHLTFIRLDGVQILFLGIHHWELGACFLELINEGFWAEENDVGGPWVERAALQLQRAYAAFKAWCKVRHIAHSETAFTLRKLSISSPGNRPYYKCKAANGMKVMEWMASVTAEQAEAHPGDQHKQVRANGMWGWATWVRTCRQAAERAHSIQLSWQDCILLEKCRRAALFSHNWLAVRAQRRVGEQQCWITIPKHHMFNHLSLIAVRERINPVFYWTFADEDFVGSMSKVCKLHLHSCTRESDCLHRWLLRYQLNLEGA